LTSKQPAGLPTLDFPANHVEQPGESFDASQAYGPIIPQRLRFEHFTVEQGLSMGTVNDILQDRNGFIWIATEDGLNKFDGHTFEVFRHEPENPNSLSSSHTYVLYEDRNGYLWIGTASNGLNRFDPVSRHFTRFVHNPDDPSSLSSNQIYDIYQDHTGMLWVATGGSLGRFDPQAETWHHYRTNPDDAYSISADVVLSIYEDAAGTLWLGTSQGLDRFDRQEERFTHYQHDPAQPKSLSGTAVRTIFEDQLGQLWAGTTDGGLNRFDQQNESFIHYRANPEAPGSLSDDFVRVIFEDLWGVLWVGTEHGLNRFNRDAEDFVGYQPDPLDPTSLGDDGIRCIYEDRAGGLWVGTAYGGVDRFDRLSQQFLLYQADPDDVNSLSENSVWSVWEDSSGILWIGTNGGGLNRFDRTNGLWRHYRHNPEELNSLSSDVVMDVYQDQTGSLWLATWGGGLNHFDPQTERFTHYRTTPQDSSSISSDAVWLIHEDRQGALWIGTAAGLNRFDPQTELFTRYIYDPNDPTSISENLIGDIYEDRSGTLWVGTHNGLNRFDRETETFTRFLHDPDDPHSLSHPIVFSILEDSAGLLWVGTYGGGLNRFDPTSGTSSHYRVPDGLANDSVYGILEDHQGRLWISTNYGISRFDPNTETFHNFDTQDGLQSQEFNFNAYFQNERGEMFFGGANGLNIFHPDDIVDNPYIPPVVLKSISQGGQPLDLEEAFEYTTQVSLRWPNNYFDFEFSALNYFHPEQNSYAYRLEGFDEGWNYIGPRRFGRYTNLPGGTYTLRLKGSNNDGLWNDQGTSLEVTVIPPFWETLWFWGIVVILMMGGGYTVYRLRVRSLEEHSRELELQVEERTRILEQRTKEIDRRRQELEALYRADEELYRYLDLDQVLQTLVDTAVNILQSDKGSLLCWDDRQENLVIRAAHNFAPETIASARVPRGSGVAGWVASNGEPATVEDARHDPRVTLDITERENIRAFMQVPIKIGEDVFGVFSADYLQPRSFNEDEERLLVSFAQRAAIAIENARLFTAEHHRSEQFRVLTEVGRRISSILDVDELLSQVVRLIRGSFDYYHVGIGLIEGEYVVYRVGSGALWDDPDFAFKPSRLKVGQEGLTGWVAATGEPVVVPDVREESRFVWMEGSQTRSELLVPIQLKDKVIGVIDVQSDRLDNFDATELELMQLLANQVGVVIENTRLYEQAQQAAVLEERTRLARELHDAVTQTLFSASLIAEALPPSWEKNPQEGRQLLMDLRQLSRGALAEMRTLLLELRPAALVDADFNDLLRQLAEAAIGREGLSVEVKIDCECGLPADVKIVFYRIAQEALNNVIKHARASHVLVHLGCSHCAEGDKEAEWAKRITLTVADDGRGFDMTSIPPDRLGLSIMRERGDSIGARFVIDSQPQSGTRVKLIWEENGRE
jgi:ligand-binding sensor domain-containing protein/signal transduction histidine kinase